MSSNQKLSADFLDTTTNNASTFENEQNSTYKSLMFNIKDEEDNREIIKIRNEKSQNTTRILRETSNYFDDINTELTDKEFKEALDWYEKQFHSAALICSNIEDSTDTEIAYFKTCIKNIPKCITRSIRQICKCKEKCIDEFFYNIQIETCSLYEYNNDAFSNEYVKCCWPFKFSNGKLKYILERTELYEAKKNFFKVIDQLCMNSVDFDIVRCAAYELQDECFNEAICLESNFVYVVTDTCENPFFYSQIDKLKGIVNFTIFDIEEPKSHIKKREIFELNDDKYIFTNSQHTENTVTKDVNYEINDLKKYGFISSCVIFSIILFILSQKKNKIIKKIMLFVCSLCLFALGIIYYTIKDWNLFIE